MQKVRLLLVGAGNRGQNYARYTAENPTLCELIAVAEPRSLVRKKMQDTYKIHDKYCFASHTDMLQYMQEHGRIDAEAIMICVQDALHAEVAVAFAPYKYHILLEKPMAISPEQCQSIAKAATENNIMLAVCHVLRYSFLTQRIKELLNNNAVGKIMNIQHVEPVGWWHFAHSYVRGNWKKEQTSSFMLMTKACHDIDWLMYIMDAPEKDQVTHLSSFGGLNHFKKANQPKGASNRCLTCPSEIERACPYSAKKIYLDRYEKEGHVTWPTNVIVSDGSVPDIESITDSLTNSDYGKCVYDSDNDVCDNHVVSMQFASGATVTCTVIAFSNEICQRKTRIYGTLGELDIDAHHIRHVNFTNGKTTKYDTNAEMYQHIAQHLGKMTSLTGHGCADYYLMKSFIDAVATNDGSKILSNAQATLKSHMLVFDAERARKEKIMIQY